jgi:predicted RNA-binding protein with PUA-like domain
MKTEPSVFAFDDFLKHPQHQAGWEGVRNYQARNFMRDQFKLEDLALIYHSSCEVPAVIGVARVVREAYPDLTALDPKSPYYDPPKKSSRLSANGSGDGVPPVSRWVTVDLQAEAVMVRPLTLKLIRTIPELATMLLVRPGQRLSVQPVTKNEWQVLMSLGQPKKIRGHGP